VPDGLSFPLIVKPRYTPRYRARVVKNRIQLEEAIRLIVGRTHQEAVAERYIAGREIQVAMIGNDPVECLPLVEAMPGTQERACPAALDPLVADSIRDAAVAAFTACGCRDYALVTLRITADQKVHVLEIGQFDIFEPQSSFELAAETEGYAFTELLERIISEARERYRIEVETPALELVERGDEEMAQGRRLVAE